MTNKYCTRGEIKKLESEIWNLKVKGTDVVAYSQRFQELALMCDRMFLEEIDKIKRYVDGLPDTIHGSVMATKPKTMQDAIEFATELMNKKINTWAEHQADNKIKSDDTTWNNHQRECLKLKNNNNRGNQVGNAKTQAKVYAVGKEGANPDNNVVMEIPQLSTLGIIRGATFVLNVVLRAFQERMSKTEEQQHVHR
nr:reverse transcriptase domain-containing protein [Tanacetum cinerariifolium]